MISPPPSGVNNWKELLFFSIHLFEEVSSFPDSQIQSLLQNSPYQVSLINFTPEVILRLVFSRFYYGVLQILIDYMQLDRSALKSDTHAKFRKELQDKKEYHFLKIVQKLAELRIWADYRSDSYEHYFHTSFSQALHKHTTYLQNSVIQLSQKHLL